MPPGGVDNRPPHSTAELSPPKIRALLTTAGDGGRVSAGRLLSWRPAPLGPPEDAQHGHANPRSPGCSTDSHARCQLPHTCRTPPRRRGSEEGRRAAGMTCRWVGVPCRRGCGPRADGCPGSPLTATASPKSSRSPPPGGPRDSRPERAPVRAYDPGASRRPRSPSARSAWLRQGHLKGCAPVRHGPVRFVAGLQPAPPYQTPRATVCHAARNFASKGYPHTSCGPSRVTTISSSSFTPNDAPASPA